MANQFVEVLIAPDFDQEAINLLKSKLSSSSYSAYTMSGQDTNWSTASEAAQEILDYGYMVLGGFRNRGHGDHNYSNAEVGNSCGYLNFNCGSYARYNMGCAEFPNKIFTWGYYGFYPETPVPKGSDVLCWNRVPCIALYSAMRILLR